MSELIEIMNPYRKNGELSKTFLDGKSVLKQLIVST